MMMPKWLVMVHVRSEDCEGDRLNGPYVSFHGMKAQRWAESGELILRYRKGKIIRGTSRVEFDK